MDVILALSGGIVALIVIICLLALGGIGFCLYFFFWRGEILKKQYKRLVERFKTMTEVLSNDCENRLSRIKYMADNQASGYEDVYIQLSQECKSLSTKERETVAQILSGISAMLKTKEKKGLKRSINEANKALNAFEEAINTLKGEINKALAQDDSYHAMILDSKTRLREFRSICVQHEVELRPIGAVLDKVFRGFDEFFNQYECYLDRADYDSAKKLLDRINKVLDALNKYGGDLYNSIPLANEVLPKRIEEVRTEARNAIEEGYPLPPLNIETVLDEMEQKLKTINGDFQTLRLAGIKESLDRMVVTLNEFEKAIAKEREAKKAFEAIHTDSNDALLKTEQKYSNINEDLKKVQKYYKVSQSTLDSVQSLGDKIETLGRTMREIDNALNNSVSPSPYSELLAMQNKVTALNEDIQVNFRDFSNTLKNLALQSEEIYKDIRSSYISLCATRQAMVSLDVKNYVDSRMKAFEGLVGQIEEIDRLLSDRPIDMTVVEEHYHRFVGDRDVFIGSVNRDLVMAKKAEMLIVYANQHRANFVHIDEETEKAENAFFDGDFPTAFDLVNKVLVSEHINEASTLSQAQ